jgi:hypothetical protein
VARIVWLRGSPLRTRAPAFRASKRRRERLAVILAAHHAVDLAFI